MTDAQLKDEILKVLLSEWIKRGRGRKGLMLAEEVHREVEASEEHTERLLVSIWESGYGVVEYYDGSVTYRANERTEPFLKSGGFTGIQDTEDEEARLAKEDTAKKRLLTKWDLRIKPFQILASVAAVASVICGIYTLWSNAEYHRLYKQTQSQVEQLRKDLDLRDKQIEQKQAQISQQLENIRTVGDSLAN